jgi:hypothetical protein
MKKVGLLFTSRNNYELLDLWLSKVDTEGFSILNIDEDSTKENKQKGKNICNKYGVTYMDREERGMLHNVVSACNYFQKHDLEWIMFITHDCYPSTPNFFTKFNNLISSGKCDQFGVIGFNVVHKMTKTEHLLSRSPLQTGGFYDRYPINTPIPTQYSKPYAIESAMWTIAAVNINQYKKHIIPTGDYHFFHTWDDIAFQFLNKNIYNICIPYLEANHTQDVKVEFGIPLKSPLIGNLHSKNEEEREYYYSKWGFKEVWFKRWGFWYDNRDSFEAVKEHYKDTLLYDFYSYDRENSSTPLKTFDL